ncbi:hypothetical protein HDU78_011017 [Chytriomyces hyalinus]|nr:hypothetical protein HDU78_011017 [Chytriomyces hyalinus]
MVKNQIRQIANEVQELLSSRIQPSSSLSKQSRVGHGDVVVYAPVSVQSATVAQQGQLGMMDSSRQHAFSSGTSIRTQGPGRDADTLPPYKEFDSKSKQQGKAPVKTLKINTWSTPVKTNPNMANTNSNSTVSDICNIAMFAVANLLDACAGSSSCICNTDPQPIFDSCESIHLGLISYNKLVREQVNSCRRINPTQLNLATSMTIIICVVALCSVVGYLLRDRFTRKGSISPMMAADAESGRRMNAKSPSPSFAQISSRAPSVLNVGSGDGKVGVRHGREEDQFSTRFV